VTRHLRRTVRALGGRKRRAWRARLGETFTPVLKSARGTAHLDGVFAEQVHGLDRVLSRQLGSGSGSVSFAPTNARAPERSLRKKW
jgi:hypothetical protein